MTTPRDTSRMDDAERLLLLGSAMIDRDGGSGFIEAQEAHGQRELVNSQVIPTEGASDDELTALGFELGGKVEGDPLFRHAKLPAGWRKEATDHSMHSRIVDELGRERVGIFYKAAFYDRRADLRITTIPGYVWNCAFNDQDPVFDDAWATPSRVLEAARAAQARERDEAKKWRDGEWPHLSAETIEKFASRHDEDAGRYDPIIAAARNAGA